MIDATVVIGTFGDLSWMDLARTRAIPSAEMLGCPVIHEHAATLHDARNAGLARVETEWVLFLDADDELEGGYLDAMSAAIADVRVPRVRYVRDGRMRHAIMPRVAGHRHACTADCLPAGNWCVIGTVVRAQLVRDIGGWRDFPWSEDWDVWLRCHLAGATFEAVPDAIYRAHVRPDSRNRAPDRTAKLAAHQAIYAANFPEPAAA